MLGVSPAMAALVFLVLTAPLSFYICWSDLRSMKIPNWTGRMLLAMFAVAGVLVLPLDVWAWRWLNYGVVLVAGFVLHLVFKIGAGDAKFAAAAAPFIDPADASGVFYLLAAVAIGGLAAHRLIRRVPALRGLAPHWVSWTRPDFPFGISIAGTFVAYLFFAAFPDSYGASLVIR